MYIDIDIVNCFLYEKIGMNRIKEDKKIKKIIYKIDGYD